jgi:peptidoglycan/xylan/chitin deacetylase (PgdA/CDA1 family)
MIKPLVPRRLQIWLRRQAIKTKRTKYIHVWPIDPKANGCPVRFAGWPGKKQFALVLTHDVDTAEGLKKCVPLMRMEKSLGFRSSFNFVPERYKNSADIRKILVENGFEVGVHGLHHDGKLFNSIKIFKKRAKKINAVIKQWGAVGFRAPAMHHNLDWIHMLNIKYDASTFDTDPFEPQSDGCMKIFPFWVQNGKLDRGYIELPYTLPQDFTAFILMRDINGRIWRQKMNWIVQQGAMALLNTHPDYMSFENPHRYDQYQAEIYRKFLLDVKNRYENSYWNALPKEVAKFWEKEVLGA